MIRIGIEHPQDIFGPRPPSGAVRVTQLLKQLPKSEGDFPAMIRQGEGRVGQRLPSGEQVDPDQAEAVQIGGKGTLAPTVGKHDTTVGAEVHCVGRQATVGNASTVQNREHPGQLPQHDDRFTSRNHAPRREPGGKRWRGGGYLGEPGPTFEGSECGQGRETGMPDSLDGAEALCEPGGRRPIWGGGTEDQAMRGTTSRPREQGVELTHSASCRAFVAHLQPGTEGQTKAKRQTGVHLCLTSATQSPATRNAAVSLSGLFPGRQQIRKRPWSSAGHCFIQDWSGNKNAKRSPTIAHRAGDTETTNRSISPNRWEDPPPVMLGTP